MTKTQTQTSTEKGPAISSSSLKNHKDIKKLLDLGVQRGYLTFEEVNELLPTEVIQPQFIDEIMHLLSENEIEVIDARKPRKEAGDDEEVVDEGPAEFGAPVEVAPGATPDGPLVEGTDEEAPAVEVAEYARGADPVKMYLKKMGSVSLLTREGEVEIAKRIEEGEIEILRALLASKLGTLAIVELGDRLETARTKVKDVIRGVEEEVRPADPFGETGARRARRQARREAERQAER